MTRWSILTGEYPPQQGGVSDYTRLLAEGLASAGDEVTVFSPPQATGSDPDTAGVCVYRLPDRFGPRSLARLDRELAQEQPDRLLVQYVPHAFGLKAMNIPFAAWLGTRGRRAAPLWVMFHEVAFPFVRRPLRHNIVAVANRAMARLIAGAADRILISIPAWGPLLRRICPRSRPAEWLPIPCNVPTTADPAMVAVIRSRHAPGSSDPLIGHFGTFGKLIIDLLEPAVVALLRAAPHARVLLIGRGSDRFHAHLAAACPDLAGRIAGTGELSPASVAGHLRACDLLLQPYPDGVSTRRTSVMAGLANGVPVVTNLGALSEPLWEATAGAAIVPGPDPIALAVAAAAVIALSPGRRLALADRGAELYFSEFGAEQAIARLRDPGLRPASAPRQ